MPPQSAIGCISRSFRLSPSIEYWRSISAAYIHELLVDPQTEVLREKQVVELPHETATQLAGLVPAMVGAEWVDADFITAVWTLFHDAFIREVRGRSEPVEEILRLLAPGQALLEHRVHFHLVENRQEEKTPFAFLATYSTLSDASNGLRHLPLGIALKEFGDDIRRLVSLLSSVHKAAVGSNLIRAILDSEEIFHPLRFTPVEAFQFLREAPQYDGLAMIKGKWTVVDRKSLQQNLDLFEKARKMGRELRIPFSDAIRMLLGLQSARIDNKTPWDGEVLCGDWIKEVLGKLRSPASLKAKEIPAAHRIVMTGTPVENRIGDIWSLFDFTNKGLLGSAQSFKKFAKSLSDRPEGYGRMRQVIQPYILRRMKTDKSIIADLPEKIEMKTWAILSKKQRVLYQRFVNDLSDAVLDSEGMKRKGLILSFLMKFKQVCNHPDQVAGSGRFREMVGPLDDFLKSVFGRPGIQLHGGTAVGKRKEIVAAFQNEDEYVPYFVLSLKAGGVGLNLTAANHVIHFDRWWNPAVEKQAEDRAFRIGQKRSVVVHKFVCKGTVEERIDDMIESKIELSQKLLSSGAESWITEMSNDQIREMFTLTLTGEK